MSSASLPTNSTGVHSPTRPADYIAWLDSTNYAGPGIQGCWILVWWRQNYALGSPAVGYEIVPIVTVVLSSGL